MTKEWRCFHCDEVFTDKAAAREHFGATQLQAPACTIDVAEYRAMETRMHRYNEEDTDLHRQIYGMQAEHQTALRREEEKGYARGLEAATAALRTLDRLGYTYTQGAELWKPPVAPTQVLDADGTPQKLTPAQVAQLQRAIDRVFDAPDPKAKCWCETCEPLRTRRERMIVCPDCGNKRCPRATWHGYACGGSNDVGQKGSSWEHVKS